MMETESLRPDADHSPKVQNDDVEGDDIEHGLGAQPPFLLSPPEGVDSNGLGCDSNYQDVGEFESIVRNDTILKSANHGDGCVQGVAEEEIANEVDEGLFEMPNLSNGTV